MRDFACGNYSGTWLVRTAETHGEKNTRRSYYPRLEKAITAVIIENGVNQNPTIKTLTKIAKALGVSLDDLMK